MNRYPAMIGTVAWLCLGLAARAQVTYTGIDIADAFVATGSPGNPEGADLTGMNFGGAGIIVVAPAASAKGEFQGLLKFDLGAAVTLFDTSYGPGQWQITAISLTLTSNYGTAGVQPNNSVFPIISSGNFVIEWLADDDWAEGTGMPNRTTTDGVTYDSLPDLLAGHRTILGTNTYIPPGNNIPVTYSLPLSANLVSNVMAGSEVTLHFYAADDQIGYLFNSYNYGRGNEPMIQVTASAHTAPVVLSGDLTNGFFHLTGQGSASVTYQVQAISNLGLTNWQTLGSVMADGSGLIQFSDPATNQPQRFYRIFH